MGDARRATLALLGLRGSGKTSVGRLLAERLGRPFLDLDRLTVEASVRAGDRGVDARTPAGEVLARIGEPAFREHEAEALRRVLEPGQDVVLATGGGTCEREDNRAWLRRAARRVWLRVPVPVLQERLARDPTPRPPLVSTDAVAEVEEIARRREPLLAELAELVVDAGEATPEEIAARILRALA